MSGIAPPFGIARPMPVRMVSTERRNNELGISFGPGMAPGMPVAPPAPMMVPPAPMMFAPVTQVISVDPTAQRYSNDQTAQVLQFADEPDVPEWAWQAAQATGKSVEEIMHLLMPPVPPPIPDWARAAAEATGKTPEEIMNSLAAGSGPSVSPAPAVMAGSYTSAPPERRSILHRAGSPSRGGSVTFSVAAPTVVPVPAVVAPMVSHPSGQNSRAAAANAWRGSLAVRTQLTPRKERPTMVQPVNPHAQVRARSAPRSHPTGTGADRIAQLAQPRSERNINASPQRVRTVSEFHPSEDPRGCKTRFGGAVLQSAVNDYFSAALRRETIVPWDKQKRVVKGPHSDMESVKFGFDPSRRTVVQDAVLGIGFGGATVSHKHAHTARGCHAKGY